MEQKTKILLGILVILGVMLLTYAILMLGWMFSGGICPSDVASFNFMRENPVANQFTEKYPHYFAQAGNSKKYDNYYKISFLTTEGNRTLTLNAHILFGEKNRKVLDAKFELECFKNNETVWAKTQEEDITKAINENLCFVENEIITKSQAISIANSTEEVRGFLKLYPDAKISVNEFLSPEQTLTAPGGKPVWAVDLKYSNITCRISIDKKTGEIIAKYPKLEYIKNSKYCERDKYCILVEPICGNLECTPDNLTCEQLCRCTTAVNFIHQSRWKEKSGDISCTKLKMCKMCAPTSSFEAICINNTCTAVEK